MRRGQLMAKHEFLSKGLAGFKHCRALGGPEGAHSPAGQLIDQAEAQRDFRANDGQVRLLGDGYSDHVGQILLVNRHASGQLRDTAIAGCTDDFIDARRLANGPDQSVLAAG